MFSVLLDSSGYYTGVYSESYKLEGGITVDTLPSSGDPLKDTCYRWNPEDNTWRLNDAEWMHKLAQRITEEEAARKEAERLAAISNENLNKDIIVTMSALTEIFELLDSMI